MPLFIPYGVILSAYNVLEHPSNPGYYILFKIEEEEYETMHLIDLNGNLMDEIMESRNYVVEKNKKLEEDVKAIKSKMIKVSTITK